MKPNPICCNKMMITKTNGSYTKSHSGKILQDVYFECYNCGKVKRL